MVEFHLSKFLSSNGCRNFKNTELWKLSNELGDLETQARIGKKFLADLIGFQEDHYEESKLILILGEAQFA